VRRERRLVLQVPEVLIEASANIGMEAEKRVRVSFVSVSPLRLGIAPPFIGQGESNLQVCRNILLRARVW
jgi:hypothetical protein